MKDQWCPCFFLVPKIRAAKAECFGGAQRCSLYDEDGAKDDTSTIRARRRQETVTGSHFELSNNN